MHVRPCIISLVVNFLNFRMQTVKYKGQLSQSKYNSVGVPQGTKLGAILFLIMIKDVCKLGSTLFYFKYVYDLTMTKCRTNTQISGYKPKLNR